MKVKVSYSVDIAEVPETLKDMLDKSNKILLEQLSDVQLASKLARNWNRHNICAEIIDEVRKQLAEADSMLLEAHHIAVGLHQYGSTPEGEGVTKETLEPPSTPPKEQEATEDDD